MFVVNDLNKIYLPKGESMKGFVLVCMTPFMFSPEIRYFYRFIEFA